MSLLDNLTLAEDQGSPFVRVVTADLRALVDALVERGLLADPAANTRGKVQRNGAHTSQAAALAVMPRTGSQRFAVLRYLADAGSYGATDPEMKVALRIQRARTRRQELEEGGWVEYSGRDRRIPGTGNMGKVWVLTAKGREQFGLEALPSLAVQETLL